jgi:hybrid cluster-associated redox disulfide protein
MAIKKITKKMTFGELLEYSPKASKKLAELGLFCGGCPMAQMETIEQGANAHGLDPEKLVNMLNKQAGKKKK